MNLFNPVNQPPANMNFNSNMGFNPSGTNQFNSIPISFLNPQLIGPNSAGNPSSNSAFGNTNLTGNNSLFPQGGNNNLFTSNTQNNTMGGGGGAWNQQNQPNTNNNLFRSSTMPSSLFPGPGINNNNNAGTGTNNMFQSNSNTSNTNNLFRSNTMMNSNNNTQGNNFMNPNSNNSGFNNNLFTTNNNTDQSRTHGYNTRNSVLPPFGDKGTVNIKYMPRKNMENLLICSITSARECKDKSLEELRAEDYAIIKAGQVPDNIKQVIQKNAQMADGINGNGMMIGSSNTNNTMFGNQNTNSMMGQQGSNPNNIFTPNSNNTNNGMNRGGGWPGMNSSNTGNVNNPFQPQNSLSNNNSLPAFGNSQNTMNNNPFNNTNNTNNPFGNNNNQQGGGNGGFFNNGQSNTNPFQNNSTNNQLFNGNNKFQPQGPNFTMNSNSNQLNNPFANNNNANNPFQQRQGQGPTFMPTNGQQQQQVPNLFPNRNTNSAFPNANPQGGFMPNQQMGGGPSFLPQGQFQQQGNGFMPNNNPAGGLPGTNPQMFSLTNNNPHLFPQSQQMGGGFPGQFNNNQFANPNFSQQGMGMGMGMQYPSQDPMGNPHLFPYQSGQVPYMPTNQGGYPYPGNYPGYPNSQFYPSLNFDKFQNSIMTPYGEDPNRSNYLPRNTLNDVASNLENRFSSERGSPENSNSSSYLPYNPFKRRTNRLMDITNREIVREPTTFAHKYQNSSMIRKPDDAFSFIKKSKYNEDDVEIFMKPKLNLTHGRGRSWSPSRKERSISPAYSRERDSYVEAPIRNTAKSIYNSTIRVNAMIQIEGQTKKEICVQIFEKSTVGDLKLKIIEGLRYSHVLKPEVFEDTTLIDKVAQQCILLHQNKQIAKDRILDDLRLQDGSTVELQVPKLFEQELEASSIRQQNTSGRSRVFESQTIAVSPFNMENEMTRTGGETNHPPRLTNSEYHTKPTIQELSRMSDEELAAVDGFSVWNKWGKIEFMGRVDLRGVDLDNVVSIGHRLVEVYPERNFPTEESKPVKGEKLNRPALISLYECFPVNLKCESDDPEERRQELIKKYERQALRNGYEFVDYDYENGVYRIRVKNF